MELNQRNRVTAKDENENLRDIIDKFFYYWKWSLGFIVLCVVLSLLFLKIAPKEYYASTTIEIMEEESGISPELYALGDLSLSGMNSTTVINEMEILRSKSLITEVIKNLHLNVLQLSQGL